MQLRRRQRGAAAILTMVMIMAGVALLALLIDVGLIAGRQARLEHAVEAAARAVAVACPPGTVECPAEIARHYLQANFPPAEVDTVRYDATSTLVRATAVAPHVFGALWQMEPAVLKAEFRVAHPGQP